MREYKKYKQTQQDDKYLTVLRNPAKSHQKCLQTYHDLITNKKIQNMSLCTVHDCTNYLIVRKRKNEPTLPRGKLSEVKPKIIEFYRKIGHKHFMSIFELFIDRVEPANLDQAIHEMEVIGDTSTEGYNGMDKLFSTALSVNGAAAL